jgi:1,2-diacylglycerol 3-alpha-glucosyltransferase
LVEHEIPTAKLLVVGKEASPTYSSMLRQISPTSVIFAGSVSDEELPYYYAACDIYATATLWEGFDLPIVEAQSCEKPVVAFNIGPHPEIIENGTTGFIVPPTNVNALAEAIIKLLKDDKLRQEMGENAYKTVKEKFSWDKIAQRTLQVYEEAIDAWQKEL